MQNGTYCNVQIIVKIFTKKNSQLKNGTFCIADIIWDT